MGSKVFTVGYEGRSVDEFVALVVAAGVRQIIDVRALPLSRRKGFSKTPLREALAASGIEYVHVKAAGNPFRHDAEPTKILAKYRKHLNASPAVVAEVEAATQVAPSALLCMERAHHACHRSIIADMLAVKGHTVKHL